MGYRVKGLTLIQIGDLCGSSLVHPYSDTIMEGQQVGQAELTLGETMLVLPLHDLSQHRGETDRPVVLGVILFILLKNGCDVTFFSSHQGHHLIATSFQISLKVLCSLPVQKGSLQKGGESTLHVGR